MTDRAPTCAVVVIGRNEGARLVACLESLRDQGVAIVYVDSGSKDDSLTNARIAGVRIVELDSSIPFSAARARNAGFVAACEIDPPDFVQFVDGDCMVEPGWIAMAAGTLAENDHLGIVTGWRAELYPNDSVYNAMCDFEWHRPAGDILTCGGDMMVRRTAFERVGGFDPTVICAEDFEFCLRVHNDQWKILRLPQSMTHHDAATFRFAQWWQRTVRCGHGFAQVGNMHPSFFVRERQRVWVYAAILPLTAFIAIWVSIWAVLPVVALYVISYWRTTRGLMAQGLSGATAAHHAVFLSLSKFPNIQGMARYYLRRILGREMHIIEYK